MRRMLSAVMAIGIGCTLFTLRANAQPDMDVQPFRVGIVAYDDIEGRAKVIESYFRRAKHQVRFASGTAEEVLDWVHGGLVDVAVLSPGAFAATSAMLDPGEYAARRRANELPAWDCKYLITPELLRSKSPFASETRRTDGGYTYRPLCLINKKNLAQLRAEFPGSDKEVLQKAASSERIQFVFGDPFSLSGTVVPKVQLRRLGISWQENSELSFGHSDTIHLLLDEREVVINGKLRSRVGFIFDGSVPQVPLAMKAAEKEKWLETQIHRMANELVVLELPPPPNAPPISSWGTLREVVSKFDVTQMSAVPELPAEVWVVRPDFDDQELNKLRAQLLKIRIENRDEPTFLDQSPPEVAGNIDSITDTVRYWAAVAGVNLGESDRARPATFSEIIHSMRHYERRYGESPRLALVLSGGGAKCAYQAGAIEEIERMLVEMKDYKVFDGSFRNQGVPKRVPPDINLVVGTSGGALNALPTAIGLNAKGNKSKSELSELWTSTQLSEILEPPVMSRAFMGAALGTLLFCVVEFTTRSLLKFARICGIVTPSASTIGQNRSFGNWLIRRYATHFVFAGLLLAFAVVRHLFPSSMQRFEPESRAAYLLVWLPLLLVGNWAALFWLLCTLAVGYLRRPRLHGWQDGIDAPCVHRKIGTELVCWRAAGAVAMLLVALSVVTLYAHKSLSEGGRLQQMVMSRLQNLLEDKVFDNRSEIASQDQRMKALSNQICAPTLVRKRDFVMTVSVLGSHGTSDRYVYLPAGEGGKGPSYEQRSLNLHRRSELSFIEDPTRMIELLIASGTIFPVFPPRPFSDMTGLERDMYIVDGGFAHNIPIEAAVDWGATHIIVIEASPRADLRERRSLLQNIGVAFDHLFTQAQLTDARSRPRVEIYTLRPQTEILKTLDFIPAKMKLAIRTGRSDAKQGRFFQYSRAPQLFAIKEPVER